MRLPAAYHEPSQAASATSSAHPVRKNPSSVHSTRCAPPGDTISTSRAAPPNRMAATAAAHAPVPDASVGPDTPLPDQDPDAIRRLDRRKLDVGALGKMRMDRQRGSQRVQPLFGHLAQHHALRIADAQRDRLDRCPAHVELLRARPARACPSRRETCSGRPRKRAARAAWCRLRSRISIGACRPASARRAAMRAMRRGTARRCPTLPIGCRRRSEAASTRPLRWSRRRSVRRRRCRRGARRPPVQAPAGRMRSSRLATRRGGNRFRRRGLLPG